MSIHELPKQDRLRLMGFVCSFAWADLEVQEGERELVRKLVRQLELDADESQQVEAWLKIPPRAEDVDPNDIPAEHKQIFLNIALQMVGADGNVDPDEMENLSLLEQLLR